MRRETRLTWQRSFRTNQVQVSLCSISKFGSEVCTGKWAEDMPAALRSLADKLETISSDSVLAEVVR